jgi:hypothetical protein
MIFYLLLICFLLLSHTLGAHRVKESTNVIKDKPVDGRTYYRDVEHTALALAHAECEPGHNHQNGENIGENHNGIEECALVSRKRRKQGIH